MQKKIILLIISCFILPLVVSAQEWQSERVYYNTDQELVYTSDAQGNRIPDFSYAGYKNGEARIPDVPTVQTISPIAGDNTAHIQNALFMLALLPADSNGIRGALQLTAGEYEIRGSIGLTYSGVTLRGVGDGSDPLSNTILKATGDTPHWRTVLSAGGGNITKWSDQVSGTKRDIVSDTVWVGDREFEVSDASPFTAGDNIIIYHPCTAGWLAAIDSGGTFYDSTGADPYADFPWSVGSQPILYNRYIKSIDGNKITIDAPVFNHLIREQSQSYIYKYARQGLRTQIGIENLRIDIVTGNQPDEAHAWTAIDLFQVEDAWIRNCTMLHFGLSGIQTGTATRVTVENCKALDPVCVIEGGKRYNFNVYTASQLILFKNCQATNGRHSYVSNGASWTSGCVFLDCTSSGAFASSEGHRRWSQGLLYDNHVELDGPRGGFNPRLLGLYNRAYYGTSHGWAAVHSVAWGCDVAGGDLIVQQPPTAQNYAIGCFGARITGVAPPASFPAPSGYIEGSNQTGLMPRSLYLAQLEDRIGPALGIGEDRDHQHTLAGFILQQNYPNPFNPQTTIAYALPEAGKVKITIFDMTGQKVTELVNARQLKGSFQVVWDGCNMAGKQVASGIYLYRMQSDNFAQSKKMILIR